MAHYQELALQRTTSYRNIRRMHYDDHRHHRRSPSSVSTITQPDNHMFVALRPYVSLSSKLLSLFRSLLNIIPIPSLIITTTTTTGCKWLTIPSSARLSISTTPSLGRKVTGTLYGHRQGLLNFLVHDQTRSHPVLFLELAMSTETLVKEMASGLVRIALECRKESTRGRVSLLNEQTWAMYCNGTSCGVAVSRTLVESDRQVLGTLKRVSMGAGIIPMVNDGKKLGELFYMRAKFERVVGNRDSEAFYMLNPDYNGGTELSIFLLRV